MSSHASTGRPRRPARDQLAGVADRGVAWHGWPPAPAHARPSAVLVLFGVLDARPADHPAPTVAGDLDVLLVGRSPGLSHHPGQVAFPGGRIDPEDDGPVAAALREAREETGLDTAGVEVLGTLGELPLTVSNHVVVPVLAWWARPTPVGVVDEAESHHVFRAPVADLVDPANRRTAVLPGRGRVGPAFLVAHDAGHHLVWGFTAFVLARLLAELGWAEPWDHARTVEVPA